MDSMNRPWWLDGKNGNPGDGSGFNNDEGSTDSSLYIDDQDSSKAVKPTPEPKTKKASSSSRNKKSLQHQNTASTASTTRSSTSQQVSSGEGRVKNSSPSKSYAYASDGRGSPRHLEQAKQHKRTSSNTSNHSNDGQIRMQRSRSNGKSDKDDRIRSHNGERSSSREKNINIERSRSNGSDQRKSKKNLDPKATSQMDAIVYGDSVEVPKPLTYKSESRATSETRSSGERSAESHANSSAASNQPRHYSVAELVASLGEQEMELPPALERRVRDFKFAQGKRRERHGDNKAWGIFGLYAHLSDIRADLEWAEDAAWRRQRGEPYLSWSDFEKTREDGTLNRPLFTYGVIALCSLMFVVTFAVNGWGFEPLNVNPLIGPSSETLVQCGARQTDLIVNEGQWYRLFSPLILHAGLIHFVINMMAMWYIGGAVEQSHGFASAAVLFIIPAVGGNILSALFLPQYISVGASGGIFGLIGGCVADIVINWNLLFLKSTTDEDTRWRHFMVLFWLAIDIFINCLIGFTPFVDNFTHLGGFMYGFCCGLSTIERLAVGFFGLTSGDCSKIKNLVFKFFGLIFSVVTIMVTTVLLVQSDGLTSPCHGCRYISCVPFPFSADEKWWYCDDCDSVTADLFVAADGSGLYEEIELKCPDGQIEEIVISPDGLSDKESVRKALPSYCRANCADVFVTN